MCVCSTIPFASGDVRSPRASTRDSLEIEFAESRMRPSKSLGTFVKFPLQLSGRYREGLIERYMTKGYGRPDELLVMPGRQTGHQYQPTNAREALCVPETLKRVHLVANPQMVARVRARLRVQVLTTNLHIHVVSAAVWKNDVIHPARHLTLGMNQFACVFPFFQHNMTHPTRHYRCFCMLCMCSSCCGRRVWRTRTQG